MAQVTVMEWQRVLCFVDGRFERVLPPGRHRYNARRTTLHTVDTRPRMLVVPGQELLTADELTLRVSLVITWAVTDPRAFLTGAAAAADVLYAAAQDAIRDVVAATAMEDLVTGRTGLSAGLTPVVRERVASLGIEVAEVRVRDLMLPGELRRAALETRLAREQGRAELERARAEAATLRSLANTARLIEDHPALLRLRTLQVAAVPGTRIVLDSGRASGDTE